MNKYMPLSLGHYHPLNSLLVYNQMHLSMGKTSGYGGGLKVKVVVGLLCCIYYNIVWWEYPLGLVVTSKRCSGTNSGF